MSSGLPFAGDVTDPYVILGVPRDACSMDIKRAYRRLAMRWHPDKNAAAPRWVFQHMAAAYDVLGVEEERAKFDRGDYSMPDDGSDEDGGGEGSSVPSYEDIFRDWSYDDFEEDELDGTV